MAGKGILLDNTGDLLIGNKSVTIGSSEMQEVAVILRMNQGEQKFTPILGANLIQLLKAKANKYEFEMRVKIHLALDNKDYTSIKNKIKTQLTLK